MRRYSGGRKLFFIFWFLALLLLAAANLGRVCAQESATLYFHDDSEMTFSYPSFQIQGYQVSGIQASSSSSSAHVFQTATTTTPTGQGLALTMSSTISLSGQPSGYIAVVAWLSNPFTTNVTLDGNVVLHVWMSSSDSLTYFPPQGSEFFMGVADYSPTGSTQFQVLDVYLSNYTVGYNGFTSSPNEYVISTLHISQHEFQTGDMLMFFAGAGSNKQGYTFTVYFDSPTWPSRADIPADPNLTVPEAPNVGWMLTPAIVVPLIVTTLGKRKNSRIRR